MTRPTNARQQRSDRTGHEQVQRDLREEALGTGRPDGEVAVDRPLEATPDSPSVDRPDHRLRAEHDCLGGTLDRLDQVASLGFVVRVHVFAAVVSRAERPPDPGEDDRPSGGVGVGIVECSGDVVDQPTIHRVQPFRTVQADDAHRAIVGVR